MGTINLSFLCFGEVGYKDQGHCICTCWHIKYGIFLSFCNKNNKEEVYFEPIVVLAVGLFPALDVDTEAPDYDLDSEDEEWVNSQSEKQVK